MFLLRRFNGGLSSGASGAGGGGGDGGGTSSAGELEAMKQEILREMRKEVQKMKQDIIEGAFSNRFDKNFAFFKKTLLFHFLCWNMFPMASTNLFIYLFCSHSPRNEQAVMGRRRIRTRRTQKTAFFYPHTHTEKKESSKERKIRKKSHIEKNKNAGSSQTPRLQCSSSWSFDRGKGEGKQEQQSSQRTPFFPKHPHPHNTVLHTVLCTTNTKHFLSSYRFLFFRPKKKKSTFPKVFPLLPPLCHISAVPCFPSLCWFRYMLRPDMKCAQTDYYY